MIAVLLAAWFGVPLWPMLRGANVARVLSVVGAFALPGLAFVGTLMSCFLGAFFVMALAGGSVDFEPTAGDLHRQTSLSRCCS